MGALKNVRPTIPVRASAEPFMKKRNPSLLTLITKAAARGIPLRAILADGTVIETMQASVNGTASVWTKDLETQAADEAFNVAFG